MTFFSQLGRIQVKDDLDDLYLYNLDYRLPFWTAIPILTYQIIDERKDRNELHSQVRYNGNGLTEKQASILNESMKHFLQTFKESDTVGEALDDLKHFQSELVF